MKLFLTIITCISLTSGLTFDCQFTTSNWVIIGSHYQCTYPKIIFTGSRAALEVVSGTHLSGKVNSDVRSVYVENQEIDFIPVFIEKFFPHLTGLQFYNTKLKAISAEDLKPFPNLKVLALPINNLVTLGDDLFKYTTNLQYIDFSLNQLQHVGSNLLESLEELREARFKSNPCVNFHATTPEQVLELKSKLIGCPSLERQTTSSTECSDECLARVDALEAKENKLDELDSKYEKKFVELEKQMRELTTSPCSPCSNFK